MCPLDPAYPQDRLSFMASDAGVKVLLTDEKCSELVSVRLRQGSFFKLRLAWHTLVINAVRTLVGKSTVIQSLPFLSWVLLFPVTDRSRIPICAGRAPLLSSPD